MQVLKFKHFIVIMPSMHFHCMQLYSYLISNCVKYIYKPIDKPLLLK